MVLRRHGILLSFCSYHWYAFSSQIWMGALGTIYKTTQMNPNEKRDFYKSLRERVYQLRMAHLFEEPCSLYEEDDDFWDCRLTYDNDECGDSV